MNPRQKQLIELLQKKSLVKVISGINNFNLDKVEHVVRSATIAQAGAVDVAAHKDIVWLARQLTELPIFASSVEPEELVSAVEHGADAVEIGNFDALYQKRFYIKADEVFKITQNTIKLLASNTPVSVTIPGHLSLAAQIQLAQQLETLGVAMLQTEGASRVVSMERQVGLLSTAEKAKLTLESTKKLCQAVNIPIMTASGINGSNVIDAFTAGASAVGIGSAINLLETESEMIEALNEIMKQVNLIKPQTQVELVS